MLLSRQGPSCATGAGCLRYPCVASLPAAPVEDSLLREAVPKGGGSMPCRITEMAERSSAATTASHCRHFNGLTSGKPRTPYGATRAAVVAMMIGQSCGRNKGHQGQRMSVAEDSPRVPNRAFSLHFGRHRKCPAKGVAAPPTRLGLVSGRVAIAMSCAACVVTCRRCESVPAMTSMLLA